MIPSITAVRMSGAATRAELPLLVLGPDLGTTASSLWAETAALLGDVFDVLAWDLPGHGYNRGVPEEGFTIAELAAGVLRVVDDVLEQRGELGGPFAYAAVVAGATVGRQLFLDQPGRVRTVVLIGTPTALDSAPSSPADLGTVVPAGYDLVRAALAGHDAHDRMAEVAEAVADGRVVVVEGAEGQQAPIESPEEVARLLRRCILGEEPEADPADLEELWARPGLDRRTRHLVAVAVAASGGRAEALAGHVRAAVADGVAPGEVVECVRQAVDHGADPGVVRIAQEALPAHG